MPNLLNSLPREILTEEDKRFIYNIFNPMFFEKEYVDATSQEKIINLNTQIGLEAGTSFETNLANIIPYNIDTRTFIVYKNTNAKKDKLLFYKDKQLIQDMDRYKKLLYGFFANYDVKILLRIFFNNINKIAEIEQEIDNMEIKINSINDKTRKEFMLSEIQKLNIELAEQIRLRDEVVVLTSTLEEYKSYSNRSRLFDKFISNLSVFFNIRTFDEFILLDNLILSKYLKFYYDDLNIVMKFTTFFQQADIFYESFKLYSSYIKIINEHGEGFALEESQTLECLETYEEEIEIDLETEYVEVFEDDDKIEIYMNFPETVECYDDSIQLFFDNVKIPKAIPRLNQEPYFGYDIEKFLIEGVKVIKLSIRKFFINEQSDKINLSLVDDIKIKLKLYNVGYYESRSTNELSILTTEYYDNFELYGTVENNVMMKLNIPFNIVISLLETDGKLYRNYTVECINEEYKQMLSEFDKVLIQTNRFNYRYRPKLYVDLLNQETDTSIIFSYKRVEEHVLYEEFVEPIEFNLFRPFDFTTDLNANTSFYKAIDGNMFIKNYFVRDRRIILNNYNQTNIEFIPKTAVSVLMNKPEKTLLEISSYFDRYNILKNNKFTEFTSFDYDRGLIIFNFGYGLQVIDILASEKLNNKLLNQFKMEDNFFKFNSEILDPAINFSNIFDIPVLKTTKFGNIRLPKQNAIILNDILQSNIIFFDSFLDQFSIVLNDIKYKINGIYFTDILDVQSIDKDALFVDSRSGLTYILFADGDIRYIDFTNDLNENEFFTISDDSIIFNHPELETSITLTLEISKKSDVFSRINGLNINSLFYSGNATTNNDNKIFGARENIINSIDLIDDVYMMGINKDYIDDDERVELFAQQNLIKTELSADYKMEQEPYILMKSKASSFKGVAEYIENNLKAISEKINISPIYLVQRNRFISEWVKTSNISNVDSSLIEQPLRNLVNDLFESKSIKYTYDDIIDLHTNPLTLNNDFQQVLIQYVKAFISEEFKNEEFNYYLIYDVWFKNNYAKIYDYMMENVNDKETLLLFSEENFNNKLKYEKMFVAFTSLLDDNQNITFESYKPIANYDDYNDAVENNNVYFEKPFKYKIIDISNFVNISKFWDKPLFMIKPITYDGVFTTNDFRFIDMNMIIYSIVTSDDDYNEYIEQDVTMIKNTDMIYETLVVLRDMSFEGLFDYKSVNLVIIKWIVERYLKNKLVSDNIDTFDYLHLLIREELQIESHPNNIVSFNRIKEDIYLGDLGDDIDNIYKTIIEQDLMEPSFIELQVTSQERLENEDIIVQPAEHYFNYLFINEYYDIIAKVLALYTEDVIATSMIEMNMILDGYSINGDETYNKYEELIYNILDEYLPMHTVLDKLFFVIKFADTLENARGIKTQLRETNNINILSTFKETAIIKTIDSTLASINTHLQISSIGMDLCGDTENLPYNYDRYIKRAGYSQNTPFEYETYGYDDEFIVLNQDHYDGLEPVNIQEPVEYAEYICSDSIPDNEIEQITDIYLTDYYNIKMQNIETDNKMHSHFIDYLPEIEIKTNIDEIADSKIFENYMMYIDTIFQTRISRTLDYYGHDQFAYDVNPEIDTNQLTMIDMRERYYDEVMHYFHDKILINLIDSIFMDVKLLKVNNTTPGYDIVYHNIGYHIVDVEDPILGETITVLNRDNTHFEFGIAAYEETDIEIIDDELVYQIGIEHGDFFNEIIINDILKENVSIDTTYSPNVTKDIYGRVVYKGTYDILSHDEMFHDTRDIARLANLFTTTFKEHELDIRIDFNFIRVFPDDPYQELIDSKFYTYGLPGFEINEINTTDNLFTGIDIFIGMDTLRINASDYIFLDYISTSFKKSVYDKDLESIYDDFTVYNTDILMQSNVDFKFTEFTALTDRYGTIMSDIDVSNMVESEILNDERDKLYNIDVSDNISTDIKIKYKVTRSNSYFKRDYLHKMVIAEDDLVLFKIQEKPQISLNDILFIYFNMHSRLSSKLVDDIKVGIGIVKNELGDINVVDKLQYNLHRMLDSEKTVVHFNEHLLTCDETRVFKDSNLNIITRDNTTQMYVISDYNFDRIDSMGMHDIGGFMGYDDNVVNSLDSSIKDSLLLLHFDNYINDDDLNLIVRDNFKIGTDLKFQTHIKLNVLDSVIIGSELFLSPYINEFHYDEAPHSEWGYGNYNTDNTSSELSALTKENIKSIFEQTVQEKEFIQLSDQLLTNFNLYNAQFMNLGLQDDIKIIGATYTAESSPIVLTDKITYHVYNYNNISLDKTYINIDEKLFKSFYNNDIITPSLVESHNINILESVSNNTNVQIYDWLLVKYKFDDKMICNINDTIQINDHKTVDVDKINFEIRDKLISKEFIDNIFNETQQITIKDSLFIHDQILIPKEKISININEFNMQSGYGKWLIESPLIIDSDDLWSSLYEYTEKITIGITDTFYINERPQESLDEHTGIHFRENLQFGILFEDSISVNNTEHTDIALRFDIDKYGIDEFMYDVLPLGYVDGDDVIQIVDSYIHDNTLNINPIIQENVLIKTTLSDRLILGHDFKNIVSERAITGIRDFLHITINKHDGQWFKSLWSDFGYAVPYEGHQGAIPYDLYPIDETEHETTNPENEITTTVHENLKNNIVTKLNVLPVMAYQDGHDMNAIDYTNPSFIATTILNDKVWINESMVDIIDTTYTKLHDALICGEGIDFANRFGCTINDNLIIEINELEHIERFFKEECFIGLQETLSLDYIDIISKPDYNRIILNDKLRYDINRSFYDAQTQVYTSEILLTDVSSDIELLWNSDLWDDVYASKNYNSYAGMIPHDYTGIDEVAHDSQEADDDGYVVSQVRDNTTIQINHSYKDINTININEVIDIGFKNLLTDNATIRPIDSLYINEIEYYGLDSKYNIEKNNVKLHEKYAMSTNYLNTVSSTMHDKVLYGDGLKLEQDKLFTKIADNVNVINITTENLNDKMMIIHNEYMKLGFDFEKELLQIKSNDMHIITLDLFDKLNANLLSGLSMINIGRFVQYIEHDLLGVDDLPHTSDLISDDLSMNIGVYEKLNQNLSQMIERDYIKNTIYDRMSYEIFEKNDFIFVDKKSINIVDRITYGLLFELQEDTKLHILNSDNIDIKTNSNDKDVATVYLDNLLTMEDTPSLDESSLVDITTNVQDSTEISVMMKFKDKIEVYFTEFYRVEDEIDLIDEKVKWYDIRRQKTEDIKMMLIDSLIVEDTFQDIDTLNTNIKTESLSILYNEDGQQIVKTQLQNTFYDLKTEEIYDELNNMIKSIYKYRMYEQLSIDIINKLKSINIYEDIINLSEVIPHEDLSNENKSTTRIVDKTQTDIKIFFNDVVGATLYDELVYKNEY